MDQDMVKGYGFSRIAAENTIKVPTVDGSMSRLASEFNKGQPSFSTGAPTQGVPSNMVYFTGPTENLFFSVQQRISTNTSSNVDRTKPNLGDNIYGAAWDKVQTPEEPKQKTTQVPNPNTNTNTLVGVGAEIQHKSSSIPDRAKPDNVIAPARKDIVKEKVQPPEEPKRKTTQVPNPNTNTNTPVDVGAKIQHKSSSFPDQGKPVNIIAPARKKIVKQKVQTPRKPKRKTTGVPKPKTLPECSKFDKKKLWPEQNISLSNAEEYGLKEFCVDRKMLKSLTIIGPYPVTVIRSCFANMGPEIRNPKSSEFGKLLLRGRVYDISPRVFNKIVDRVDCDDVEYTLNDMDVIAEFLTGGNIKKWPSTFNANTLTTLYACLHKITLTNWLPTSTDHRVSHEQARFLYKLGMNFPINFGKMVFERMTDLTKIESGQYLPYPSLIYNVLREQGFKPEEGEEFTKNPSFFRVSPIILDGVRRKNDLPYKKDVENSAVSLQVFTQKPTLYEDHVRNGVGKKRKKNLLDGGVNVGNAEPLFRKYLRCKLEELDRNIEKQKQVLKDLEQEKEEVVALLGND